MREDRHARQRLLFARDRAPPALPPPAIEQPAPHQVSYGLVTGRAAPRHHARDRRANGKRLASRPLAAAPVHARRRASARRCRRSASPRSRAAGGARQRTSTTSSACPRGRALASSPRTRTPRSQRKLAPTCARLLGARPAIYVQSLTGGARRGVERAGALPGRVDAEARDRRHRACSRTRGSRRRARSLDSLLCDDAHPRPTTRRRTRPRSGSAARRAPARQRVNELMRSIGLARHPDVRRLRASHALRRASRSASTSSPPSASASTRPPGTSRRSGARSGSPRAARGPLRASQPGFTPADARYLLWLLAHVRDQPKLDARPARPRGRRAPQGGLDQRRTPRHRARLLARRRLRRAAS